MNEWMRVSHSNISNFRSSHQVISIKKLFLKNYAIFTGKHLCWSLFFLFPEGLQLYQKEAPIQVTFLKTLILKNICKRLLVKLWPKTPVHRCSVKLLLSNVTFWSPWKHQKTKDFMMFSGWSKRNIEKKWVKTCLTKTLSTLRSSKRLRRLEKD